MRFIFVRKVVPTVLASTILLPSGFDDVFLRYFSSLNTSELIGAPFFNYFGVLFLIRCPLVFSVNQVVHCLTN